MQLLTKIKPSELQEIVELINESGYNPRKAKLQSETCVYDGMAETHLNLDGKDFYIQVPSEVFSEYVQDKFAEDFDELRLDEDWNWTLRAMDKEPDPYVFFYNESSTRYQLEITKYFIYQLLGDVMSDYVLYAPLKTA